MTPGTLLADRARRILDSDVFHQFRRSPLAIAASSLLYVAVADLIPSLHRRPEPLETVKQLLLIGLGIAVIAVAHVALEH